MIEWWIMSRQRKFQIFVVDDEPQVCKAIGRILDHEYEVSSFLSAEECLSQLYKSHVDCHLLISDVRMPGMNGLELQQKLKRVRPLLPVLLITGYGDIPLAVRAMKAGAFDFIEKPPHLEQLRRLAQKALKNQSLEEKDQSRSLTPTQRKVLRLWLDGLTSRQIADCLVRSIRTIEEHRLKIKKKLGVKTQADLYRIGSEMGVSGWDDG